MGSGGSAAGSPPHLLDVGRVAFANARQVTGGRRESGVGVLGKAAAAAPLLPAGGLRGSSRDIECVDKKKIIEPCILIFRDRQTFKFLFIYFSSFGGWAAERLNGCPRRLGEQGRGAGGQGGWGAPARCWGGECRAGACG